MLSGMRLALSGIGFFRSFFAAVIPLRRGGRRASRAAASCDADKGALADIGFFVLTSRTAFGFWSWPPFSAVMVSPWRPGGGHCTPACGRRCLPVCMAPWPRMLFFPLPLSSPRVVDVAFCVCRRPQTGACQ